MRNISFIVINETFKDWNNIIIIYQAFVSKVLTYSMIKDYIDEKVEA